MQNPEYMTVEEVAARLRYKPRTIRQEIVAGRLRAQRIGRAYRISWDDYQRFLKLTETRPIDEDDEDDVVEAVAC